MGVAKNGCGHKNKNWPTGPNCFLWSQVVIQVEKSLWADTANGSGYINISHPTRYEDANNGNVSHPVFKRRNSLSS